MFPETRIEPRDDSAFLAVVDLLIFGLVREEPPDDVYLVHIDNWFGPKWLRYSGKGVVSFPGGYAVDILVALDGHYQGRLTFPPFTRNRVVAQYYFRRVATGGYDEQCPPHLVHRRRWRWKEQILHRRVADFSRSGLFVWYSSGTVANQRGSVMVYRAHLGACDAWYAGFAERSGKWQLDKVSGTARELVAGLLEEPA